MDSTPSIPKKYIDAMKKIMEDMASDTLHAKLIETRIRLIRIQSEYLLKRGTIILEMMNMDALNRVTWRRDERKEINECFNLIEEYLCAIAIALYKNQYVKQLLDKNSQDSEMKAKENTMKEYEFVMKVTEQKIQTMLQVNPKLKQLVQVVPEGNLFDAPWMNNIKGIHFTSDTRVPVVPIAPVSLDSTTINTTTSSNETK